LPHNNEKEIRENLISQQNPETNQIPCGAKPDGWDLHRRIDRKRSGKNFLPAEPVLRSMIFGAQSGYFKSPNGIF
jgi:hypothetical protein